MKYVFQSLFVCFVFLGMTASSFADPKIDQLTSVAINAQSEASSFPLLVAEGSLALEGYLAYHRSIWPQDPAYYSPVSIAWCQGEPGFCLLSLAASAEKAASGGTIEERLKTYQENPMEIVGLGGEELKLLSDSIMDMKMRIRFTKKEGQGNLTWEANAPIPNFPLQGNLEMPTFSSAAQYLVRLLHGRS